MGNAGSNCKYNRSLASVGNKYFKKALESLHYNNYYTKHNHSQFPLTYPHTQGLILMRSASAHNCNAYLPKDDKKVQTHH